MAQKKRLLITASTFPRWSGDSEPRFVLDLAKELTKYFDVTVAAPAAIGAADSEILEGVKVNRYHYLPIHKWETLAYPGAIVPRIKEKKIRALQVPFLFFGLWKYLIKNLNNFDLVHSHWLIPQGIIQSYFSKPYLLTGHGGDVTGLNKGLIKKLKARTLMNASAITFVSKQLFETAENIQDYRKPLKEKSVNIIPMGVDTQRFSSEYRVPNYFGQKDKKVVLFVGRLVEVKGLRYLIEAMKSIDALLVVVGSGPMRDEYERLATPIRNKVRFLGSKTHEDLKKIYASADVFCMPSYTTETGEKEGFGLVVLEAMASGLPIVASKSGGIPTMIKNGYNGLLFGEKDVEDLSNKLKSVINSESCREILSRNALKTVKKYSYEIIAKQYADVLRRFEIE
ncbi:MULTISPECIES: glycosyltransferase family 4 protein [Erysipelotrichaceae]|uniref:glycosyltransferase family 4 protein n=1 Tax=Erysipelotrichaceae TaxID=128827 RepID=UPI00272980F4|nr:MULTISPECIES: glycosyltransferase family 4 protein [Erysipelotrichaceae]